jgi:plastocyanin
VRRFLILLPAILLVAGCGGSSGSSSGGNVLKTIQISEKEYSLTPSTVSVSEPGTYAFEATNDGQVAHALEIEGNGVEGKTADIEPGTSATLQVTLSKTGSYEMYCPIDGHAAQGMAGTIMVGGAAGGGTTTNPEGETTTSGDETTTNSSPGY